jgi:hypothetical protein
MVERVNLSYPLVLVELGTDTSQEFEAENPVENPQIVICTERKWLRVHVLSWKPLMPNGGKMISSQNSSLQVVNTPRIPTVSFVSSIIE